MKISKHMTGKSVVRWLDGICEGHDYPYPREHLSRDGNKEVLPGSFRRNCSHCWYALRQVMEA